MKAQQQQQDQRAAAAAGAGSASKAAAGQLSGSTAGTSAAVQDLGTVGRGKSRITLQPVSSSNPPSTTSTPLPPTIVSSSLPLAASSSAQPAVEGSSSAPVHESGTSIPKGAEEPPLESKAESPMTSPPKAESLAGSKRGVTEVASGTEGEKRTAMVLDSGEGGVDQGRASGDGNDQDAVKRARAPEGTGPEKAVYA
ncbi:MAG: hypothetical protein WDW38_006139 [Sanguina aurantia]